jgi:glycosyltransferase involved in cell wall biosynthesis
VKLLPNDTSHEQILEYHSKARISIGLSISDAISTSMLEAMAMGSFPIQSCTACASEWILNNETGLIVPPEDPEIIEGMIRKALLDDNLVNNAAVKNFQTISSRMDYNTLKDLTIQSYKKILTLSNEK